MLLDQRSRRFFPDWDRVADDTVAMLRTAAGHHPYDRNLTDPIGALSTQSKLFRARSAAHNVRVHQTGIKRFRRPVVGELTLTYEMLELAADHGTASHDALQLLGSWTAIEQPVRLQTLDRE